MKKLLIIILISLTGLTYGQKEIGAVISGNIFNLPANDTIKLVQQHQNGFTTFAKTTVDAKGDFKMPLKLKNEDYYVLLIGNMPVSLIIRNKSDIKIYGDGSKLDQFVNIVNSEESISLNEFMRTSHVFKEKLDSANAYLRAHPQEIQSVNQSFTPIFNEFQAYKNSFIQQNISNASTIAVISFLNLEKEFPIYENIITGLEKSFPNSPTVALTVQEFDKNKEQIDKMSFLDPGKIAPDFTQNRIDGTPMKLSDLRGKVVLLDFWASWCGPCRKENPNVVANYNKYKDKGFTVMSVSLDKNKEAWEAAIQRDGLTWPNHVSDLKQWGNEVAQQYQVRSIPFSVLIDKDGKIIATNLRGEALGQRLQQIFGF